MEQVREELLRRGMEGGLHTASAHTPDDPDLRWLKDGRVACRFELIGSAEELAAVRDLPASVELCRRSEHVLVIPEELGACVRRQRPRLQGQLAGYILTSELLNPEGDRERPPPAHLQAIVEERVSVGPENCRLRLRPDRPIDFEPGQFLQFDCSTQTRPLGSEELVVEEGRMPALSGAELRRRRALLRRPFSAHRCYHEGFERRLLAEDDPLPRGFRSLIRRPKDIVEVLFKKLGPGTELLASLTGGDRVDVIGPLGRPIPIQEAGQALLVGGGVGIPPLVHLAEALRLRGLPVRAFVGAQTKDDLPVTLPDAGELTEIGADVTVATDDGSFGHQGFVTDLLESFLEREAGRDGNVTVYACGPPLMLRAVARIVNARQIEAHLLLERYMGCGLGVCLSCVCKMKADNDAGWEYRLACKDGPSFRASEVIWE